MGHGTWGYLAMGLLNQISRLQDEELVWKVCLDIPLPLLANGMFTPLSCCAQGFGRGVNKVDLRGMASNQSHTAQFTCQMVLVT